MTDAVSSRPQGSPCWVSLLTHAMPLTQTFYGALFGWSFREGPRAFGPYVRALLGEQQVAGIGNVPAGRDLPEVWTTYLLSRDVDHTAELIRECGGTVAVGPLDADEAGRIVLASDPLGAVFGVWQPESHQGTDLTGAPGTVVWNELFTHESAVAEKFYSQVFGYEPEPMDPAEGDYVTLKAEGEPVAGIRGLGPDMPSGRGPTWMIHFAVEDADAAARLAVELGGAVVRPPHDSPYGRQADLTDPVGAAFTVTAVRQ